MSMACYRYAVRWNETRQSQWMFGGDGNGSESQQELCCDLASAEKLASKLRNAGQSVRIESVSW